MGSHTIQEKTYNAMQNLNKKKARQENNILAKMIKSDDDIFSYFRHYLFLLFNYSLLS